ncbi:unnamed protein product [Ilex paraguariensis]|uniref:Uncharacterized protein n=1 Tax=Ilex paraguariensis TaxID=185542 RepID=A0ABC8T5G7_9AQUA
MYGKKWKGKREKDKDEEKELEKEKEEEEKVAFEKDTGRHCQKTKSSISSLKPVNSPQVSQIN